MENTLNINTNIEENISSGMNGADTEKNKNDIKTNVEKIALIFEGGGMRAAFSCGISNTLLENGIYFDYVAGISAGSSMTVNYIARDRVRTKRSFVELAADPNFGGWKTFLQGKGFFNSEYIYEQTAEPGQALPLDFDFFMSNPTRFRIIAYDMAADGPRIFTNSDIKKLPDLMKIVRASSSLPIFMKATEFEGKVYYDGGVLGGIPLDVAISEGYEKFFIVRTQERSYRKKPVKHPRLMEAYFRKNPAMAKRIIDRPQVYNDICDRIDMLEAQGKAYVVYPEDMKVSNREKNVDILEGLYRQGLEIGKRDLEKWKKFINNI